MNEIKLLIALFNAAQAKHLPPSSFMHSKQEHFESFTSLLGD